MAARLRWAANAEVAPEHIRSQGHRRRAHCGLRGERRDRGRAGTKLHCKC